MVENRKAISGMITADDYVAAQRLHLRKWRKRQYLILGILTAAGVIVMSIGHFMIGVTLFGAGAGGSIVEIMQYKRTLPRIWRKLFEQQKSIQQSFHYRWDEVGLHVSTPLAQATRPWPHFIRRTEDTDTLLLYHSDAMFELIPKRWFENARLPEELEALLTRHIGSPNQTNPSKPIATESEHP